MNKTVTIDWMSFTDRESKRTLSPTGTPFEDIREAVHETGRFGYRLAVKYPSGTIVMFDGAADNMGEHYIYSGKALNFLAFRLSERSSILSHHTSLHHTCSRIDLAIDVKDCPGFMSRLKALAESGNIGGSARKLNIVASPSDGGCTIYAGSRQSDKMVRIYDKGVESGVGGDWVRIEAELKGDVARRVAKAIVKLGDKGLSDLAQGIITSTVEFPDETWNAVFDGKVIPIGQSEERERQTEKWLLTSVAKTLAKFEMNHPDLHMMQRLIEAVYMMVGRDASE